MTARFRLVVLILVSLFLCAACSPRVSPEPAVVSHLNILEKKSYLDKTRSTMKIFYSTAADLRHRGDTDSQSEFAEQVADFIRLRVRPIVNDFEARNNLETRLQVAELQLLCAMVYFELEQYRQVRLQLKQMERRYENQPEILTADLDQNEFGFRTIDKGINSMWDRLYHTGDNLTRPHLF